MPRMVPAGSGRDTGDECLLPANPILSKSDTDGLSPVMDGSHEPSFNYSPASRN